MNFILNFVHKIREKFVHEFVHEFMYEFMPEDYVFKGKILGKVSVSLKFPEIFQCRVLSAWALRYVHIIKGNILFKII